MNNMIMSQVILFFGVISSRIPISNGSCEIRTADVIKPDDTVPASVTISTKSVNQIPGLPMAV